MKKIIAVIFLLFSTTVNAQQIWIDGTVNCGLWLEARSSKMSQNYEAFIHGMINGIALGQRIDIWRFKGTKVSREQFYYWMDEYCRKNPLKDVVQGTLDFADEMTDGEFNRQRRR